MCFLPKQVEISFRLYWELDYSRTTRCNRETIASGQLMGPETPGYLECVDGCTPTRSRVSDVSIHCVAYSVLENWMYGVRSNNYTLPASADQVLTLEYDILSPIYWTNSAKTDRQIDRQTRISNIQRTRKIKA